MLGRVDHDKWTLCNDNVIKKHALDWKVVESSREQNRIFKEHSTQYLELWHLPYWPPVLQLPVDPMHCLLENLIAIHFNFNLGLIATNAMLPDPPIYAFLHNFTTVNNSATNLPPGLLNKEAKQVSTIHQLPKSAYTDKEDNDSQLSQLQKQLMNKNILALKFMCNDLNILPGHCLHSTRLFKKDWISKHMCWVSLIPALWHVILY